MVLLDTLEDIDFLQGMAPEYLRHIAWAARLKEYPPDTILFREGENSPYVYLVTEGNLSVEVQGPGGEAVVVDVAGPGELLGWSPILELGPTTGTARTLNRCRVLALDASRMLTLCDQDPRFAIEFLRRTAATLARRLGATRRQLLSCAGSVARMTAV